MKRFQSRLEALQRVREQVEKLAKLEAGVCRQQAAEAEKQLELIKNQIATTQTQGAAMAAAGVVDALHVTAMATSRLQLSEHSANIQKSEADKRLAEAVRVVATAQRELEVVETKIDRERSEHRREVIAEEENDRQERTAIRFHGNM